MDRREHGTNAEHGLTIVGIGASAGGLDALRALFARVPADSGLAYVVVVHLSPDHESFLADLLQPHCAIPVRQVSEDTELEANQVYVIPPGRNLTTIDTHVRLDPLEASRRERAPIDHFFRTLAEIHGPRSVGVILSGTGSDGTNGIRNLKARGGLTVVQAPNEAAFDGMPQSAIATGLVDRVLPVAAIPAEVIRYARTDPKLAVPRDEPELPGDDIAPLQQIFAQIHLATGRDFSQRKVATVVRRIRRRMQLHHIEDVDRYVSFLRESSDEVLALADELLITVTSFFRDRAVFEAIERDVIPRLFAGKGPDEPIRAWSVGCATGEEAYSLAMLLVEHAETVETPHRVQVFASDLHQRSLQKAREGLYPDTIEADVSADRLDRFFVKEDGAYRVRRELREMAVFAPHDLLADPPFSRVDLVLCRNLLIYLRRSVQRDVARLFHYALRPRGILVLGTSETIDGDGLFRPLDKKNAIYERRSGPTRQPQLPVFPLSLARLPSVAREREQPAERLASFGMLHERLVERYAPPSLVVDAQHSIVHVSEHAGRFLSVPGGETTSDVVKLVREELRIELRASLRSAAETGEQVRSAPIRLTLDGEPHSVVLHVHPARGDDMEGFFLVVFEEERSSKLPPEPAGDGGGADARSRALEAELALTRQQIRAVVAQYERTEEEMQAANEELQSTNEELRSTMEELETSKEELQSLNEELTTVNQENQHKVEELGQLTGDLQNLFLAADIATLFLDRTLRILRFTPRVGEIFNVRASDRGRPLTDITHRLGYEKLVADALEVLSTLVPIEREVQSEDGTWFLARVLPYRTVDQRIDGVVLTFVNVSPLKQAEYELRSARESLLLALDAAAMGAWELDVETASITRREGNYDRIFGLSGAAKWSLSDERARVLAEDRARFDAAHENARTADSLDVEVRIEGPDGRTRWIKKMGRTRPLLGTRGGRMSGVVLDVTSQREWNAELEREIATRTTQVRALVTQLARAEHEERERVSRVLHDDLQQLLYGAQMRLGILRSRLDEAGRADEARETQEAQARIADAIAVARTLTVDLSPPVLEKDALVEALGWLVPRMKDLHGLDVVISAETDARIPDEGLRIFLFQVVRELLFNVVKHAGVSAATVTLRHSDETLEIVVADAGSGFDPAATRTARPGSGIRTLTNRLALFGAELRLESSPGAGTRALVSVPFASLGGLP